MVTHRLFSIRIMDAARIVTSAILGMDFETVIVNGKTYIVTPPTIKRLAGAGYYLSNINEGKSVRDLLLSLGDAEAVAHALSWMIQGDDGLFEELSLGTFEEVVEALDVVYSLISVKPFLKLSGLARNVANLTAKPKL